MLAGDDEHLLELSASRRSLAALLPVPPHETVVRALDDLLLHQAAKRCGLPVPELREQPPRGPQGWLAKRRIYRPGRSHDVVPAADAPAANSGLVYQRRVPGGLLAVVVLAAPDGRLLPVSAQEARALHPEPCGVSVRAEVGAPGAASSLEAASVLSRRTR